MQKNKSQNQILGQQASITVAGVTAAEPVSEIVATTEVSRRAIVCDVAVSAVTVVGSVTLKLQDRFGSNAWNDVDTVSVAGTGVKTMRLLDTVAADQPVLPLRDQLRVVVVNTNAGDTVTVTSVFLA